MIPHCESFMGLMALGVAAGLASGLFGVGGGFMLSPLLIALFKVEPAIAVGSSLAQMIAVGTGATWQHAARKSVDARLVWHMVPGTVADTALGKAALHWLEKLGALTIAGRQTPVLTLALSLAFALLLFGIAVHFWHDGATDSSKAPCLALRWANGPWPVALPASDVAAVSSFSLAGTSILVGTLAGLLGIGGGVALILLLVCGFAIPLRTAIGTTSTLTLVSAVAGAAQYALAGQVDPWLVIILMAGSVPGMQAGVRLSHRLLIARLRRVFAILASAVAVLSLVHVLLP